MGLEARPPATGGKEVRGAEPPELGHLFNLFNEINAYLGIF